MEGNLRFKIDWASLIDGRKFTVFEGTFQVQVPGGACTWNVRNGGFFALRVWGLIFGGAYFWNFTALNQLGKEQSVHT